MKRFVLWLLGLFVAWSSAWAQSEKPDLGQLYLVGNATGAGWNPGAALEMTKVDDGVFVWSGPLSVQNGKEFKFLNQLNTWDKTIVAKASSNMTIRPGSTYDLNYRPKENSPADSKFLITVTGEYYIFVNLNTMKMSIDYAAPTSGALYITGTATDAGADAQAASAMEQVESGLFTWSGRLSAGEGRTFHFLTQKGNGGRSVHPQDAHVSVEVETEYGLMYRPFADVPGDYRFSVAGTGFYTVDVNMNDMTVIVEESGSTGVDETSADVPYRLQVWGGALHLMTVGDRVLRQIVLCDFAGRCCSQYADVCGSVLLGEGLPSGVYMIKTIDGEGKASVQKVMVR